MIQIGKKQRLIVVKKVDFGIYLSESRESGPEERVLLPKKQAPAGVQPGDELEVFVYLDSQDRPIATVREAKAQVGQIAVFTVAETGRIGAFLDWGLEKELLLPFREQTQRVKPGEEVLAAVYLDKSSRLCATMKLYHYLKTNAPYVVGDEVEGRVYEISDNYGVFVAVDDRYSALIPKREAQGSYRVGELLKLRVTLVREDGKLNVTSHKKAYLQMAEDAEKVMAVLGEYAGVLPFDDKAAPEVISRELGMSKAAFKRAVGRLLKERKIELRDQRIYAKER